MEIDNSNLSSIIASSISKLNIASSNGASVSNRPKQKPKEQIFVQENKENDVNVIDDVNLKKSPIDVKEVQKYAGMIGENLTIEEIQYGLKYGRSVIADFSA